jgi:hypothetical protein
MPGLQDAVPGHPQRAWQRRPNPLLMNLLRLAERVNDFETAGV